MYLWFVSAIGVVSIRKRLSSKVNRSLAKVKRLLYDLYLDGLLLDQGSISDGLADVHHLVTRAYANLTIIGGGGYISG